MVGVWMHLTLDCKDPNTMLIVAVAPGYAVLFGSSLKSHVNVFSYLDLALSLHPSECPLPWATAIP